MKIYKYDKIYQQKRKKEKKKKVKTKEKKLKVKKKQKGFIFEILYIFYIITHHSSS